MVIDKKTNTPLGCFMSTEQRRLMRAWFETADAGAADCIEDR